jgi:hypothetical protein
MNSGSVMIQRNSRHGNPIATVSTAVPGGSTAIGVPASGAGYAETRAPASGRVTGPAMDSASFFISADSQIAPVSYANACQMVEGKTPANVLSRLAETLSTTATEARAVPADLVGPAIFAPMRVDEFVRSRIVEAVVHGIDLAQALNRPIFAIQPGVAGTAALLDDLLARCADGSRPPGLEDDLAWVLEAAGRSESQDNRLPLLG